MQFQCYTRVIGASSNVIEKIRALLVPNAPMTRVIEIRSVIQSILSGLNDCVIVNSELFRHYPCTKSSITQIQSSNTNTTHCKQKKSRACCHDEASQNVTVELLVSKTSSEVLSLPVYSISTKSPFFTAMSRESVASL